MCSERISAEIAVMAVMAVRPTTTASGMRQLTGTVA